VDQAAQAQRVVATMLERAICLECLAADVDMTDSDVAGVLERIANKVRFSAQASGYCEVCEQTTGPVTLDAAARCRPVPASYASLLTIDGAPTAHDAPAGVVSVGLTLRWLPEVGSGEFDFEIRAYDAGTGALVWTDAHSVGGDLAYANTVTAEGGRIFAAGAQHGRRQSGRADSRVSRPIGMVPPRLG
jgi:hypothetical protein